jgi:hypothetical protein
MLVPGGPASLSLFTWLENCFDWSHNTLALFCKYIAIKRSEDVVIWFVKGLNEAWQLQKNPDMHP